MSVHTSPRGTPSPLVQVQLPCDPGTGLGRKDQPVLRVEPFHLLPGHAPAILRRRKALVLVGEVRSRVGAVQWTVAVEAPPVAVVVAEAGLVRSQMRRRLPVEASVGTLAVGQQHVVYAAQPNARITFDSGSLPDDLVAKVLRPEDRVQQTLR
jgi:hypothetical protein